MDQATTPKTFDFDSIINPEGLTFEQALKRLKTEKQRRFVLAFLKCFNYTQAAVKAGYSKKTAHDMGYQNSMKPVVQLCLYLGTKRQQQTLLSEADQVVAEAGIVAYSDMADFATWGTKVEYMRTVDGELVLDKQGNPVIAYRGPFMDFKDSANMPASTTKAVRSIKCSPGQWGTKMEITLHDKTKAIDLLGKHHRLWEDKLKLGFDPDDPLVQVLKSIDGKTRGLPPKSPPKE